VDNQVQYSKKCELIEEVNFAFYLLRTNKLVTKQNIGQNFLKFFPLFAAKMFENKNEPL